MILKHFTLALSMCFVIVPKTNGQDAAADFKKINLFYHSNKGFAANIRYQIFSDWSTNVVMEEKDGEMKKWGDYKYYKVGTMETWTTPLAYMAVDHTQKRIFLSGMRISAGDETEKMLSQLDDLLKLCTKLDYKNEGSGKRSYTLSYPHGKLEKIKIVFDAEHFFIHQLVIYSKLVDNEKLASPRMNRPRLEIAFSKMLLDKKYTQTDFSFHKYLDKKKDKWTCSRQYAQYDFINQLNSSSHE